MSLPQDPTPVLPRPRLDDTMLTAAAANVVAPVLPLPRLDPADDAKLAAVAADLEDATERRRRHRRLMTEALLAIQEACVEGLPPLVRVLLEVAGDLVSRARAGLD